MTATADSVASGEDCSKAEPTKYPPAATRATREDILREMRADMERPAWKMECEFGREHGYCLYPPDRSEPEAGNIDTDGEEDSTAELLPRAFPLANCTRGRRGAVSVGRSGREHGEQSNRTGDPNWSQNLIGAFAEYQDWRRTEERARPNGEDRRGASGCAQLVEISTESEDTTHDNDHTQEEDEVLFYLTYEELPSDVGEIMLYASLDGIDWREGYGLVQRWNDFLAD